jgi:hypothetical protein
MVELCFVARVMHWKMSTLSTLGIVGEDMLYAEIITQFIAQH